MIYNSTTQKYEAATSATFGGGSATSSGFAYKQFSGATLAVLDTQAATSLNILNNTGTDIEIWKSGAFIVIPNGVSILVNFITNANQISVRRKDLSATIVTLYYVWEN